MPAEEGENELAGEVARLRKEVETYKKAFETTAADRDRLASNLRAVTDPLDAGYFRLDMPKFGRPENRDWTARLGTEWEQYFREENYKHLVQSIFENTRVTYALPVPEEHAKPIAAYLLACFFAWQREFEKTQKYADSFDFAAPADGSDFLPYEIKQSTRLLRARQQIAIENGRPGIFVVSLMKSASAFFSAALSEILEVPILRASIGEGMRSTVIKSWADQIAEGGATTHEHFQALPVNLDTLARSQVRQIWVLVRDPRDAAFSLRHMRVAQSRLEHVRMGKKAGSKEGYSKEDAKTFVEDCRIFGQWIDDWIRTANEAGYPFEISFLKYSDVTTGLPDTLRSILQDRLDPVIERRMHEYQAESRPRSNFRKGVGREWENAFSQDVCEVIWRRMSENIKSLLDLNG